MRTFIFIVVSVFFLNACQSEQSYQQLIEAGKQAADSGKFESAVISLKNAIQMEPENPEARKALGLVYLKQGNVLSAIKELNRSAANPPLDDEMLSAKARAYYLLNDSAELLELAKQSDESGGELAALVRGYLALQAINEEDNAAALAYAELAKQFAPESAYTKLAFAWLNAKQNPSESLSVAEDIIAAGSKLSESLLLSGHLLSFQEKYHEAIARYEKYIAIHPMLYSARIFLADALIGSQQYTKAKEQTAFLLSVYPSSSKVNTQHAQVLFVEERFSDAKVYADNALTVDNRAIIPAVIAGLSAYKLNQFEQAYNALKPVKELLPNGHVTKKIFAKISLTLGYAEDAASAMDFAEGFDTNDVELLGFAGNEFYRLGDIRSAVAATEKAKILRPDDPAITAQLGALKVIKGDTSGTQELQQAVSLAPDNDAINAAAVFNYLNQQQFDQALELLANWRVSSPESDLPYALEGIVYAQRGDETSATKFFEQSININPANPTSLSFLGYYAYKEGKYDLAASYYENAVKHSPNNTKALDGLTRSNVRNKNIEHTITFLEGMLQEDKENVKLNLGLALNYMASNQPEKAISLLSAVEASTSSAEVQIMLGDIYYSLNNLTDAEKVYEKLYKEYPASPIAIFRHIVVKNSLGKFDQALSVTEESRARYSDNIQLKLLEANLLILKGDKNKAGKAIEALQKEKIDLPYYYQILSNYGLLIEDLELAVDNFNELYVKRPNNKNLLNLVRALRLSKQMPEAQKLLERHVDSEPKNSGARMLLAEQYKLSGDWEKVSEQYLKTLALLPDNPIVYNNLAWNEYKIGRLDEAEKYAATGYSKVLNSPVLTDTYAVILLALDKNEQALSLYRKLSVDKLMNLSINAGLTYSKALIANGQKEDAKYYLAELSDKAPSAKERKSIHDLLSTL